MLIFKDLRVAAPPVAGLRQGALAQSLAPVAPAGASQVLLRAVELGRMLWALPFPQAKRSLLPGMRAKCRLLRFSLRTEEVS